MLLLHRYGIHEISRIPPVLFLFKLEVTATAGIIHSEERKQHHLQLPRWVSDDQRAARERAERVLYIAGVGGKVNGASNTVAVETQRGTDLVQDFVRRPSGLE